MLANHLKRAIGRRSFVAKAAALASSWPLASLAGRRAEAQQRATPPADGRFTFALIGDMPYTRAQEAEYARVMADLDARDLAFVVHIGDFQFDPRPYERDPALARPPGADETYQYVRDSFAASKHPLIVTPGDNDWADLVELTKTKFDPLERLAKVRALFYPAGRSFGQRTLPVMSQADDPELRREHGRYRENLAWSVGGVSFATLHIIGSDDNAKRLGALDDERRARKAANLAWLKKAFARAKQDGSRGLVLFVHANMGFENRWPGSYFGRYYRPLAGVKAPAERTPTPYDDYLQALAEEMEGYDKPTALLHGDTHLFRIDKPLFGIKKPRPFENFTRVETFGWPDTHWVRVTVDPSDPQLFSFAPQIVPGNRQHHAG